MSELDRKLDTEEKSGGVTRVRVSHVAGHGIIILERDKQGIVEMYSKGGDRLYRWRRVSAGPKDESWYELKETLQVLYEVPKR